MCTQLSIRKTEEHNHNKQRRSPDGALIEFLASPDQAGAEICLIRGTILPGVAVPLHSHPDMEVFYVLEGSVETFQSRDGTHEWVSVGTGNVVIIPGNIRHTWRNCSRHPATILIVTTSKMYEFFHEVTKPFDPDQPASPSTPEELQGLFRAAEKYGYWIGSPEENAAIGLSMK